MTKEEFIIELNRLRELRLKGAPFSYYKKEYEKLACGKDLGELYRSLFLADIKSIVYTPEEISYKLIKDFKREGRYLEICAGTGNITESFLKNTLTCPKMKLTVMDEDPVSLMVLEERLFYKSLPIPHNMAYDFLKLKDKKDHNSPGVKEGEKYDGIFGNPPYLGHKDMDIDYKSYLKENYGEVYSNKGDIYYAFFKAAYDLLKEGGILSLIVSRYFLEAESARGLRSFILRKYKILYINDFFGERPFGRGIDPAIIVLQKLPFGSKDTNSYPFKATRRGEDFVMDRAYISYESLRPLKSREFNLKEVIRKFSSHRLGDIGTFYQGVITGLDKAFILNEDTSYLVEGDLLVPWIKNSHITRDFNKDKFTTELKLILPPEKIDDYLKFKRHIEKFKEKLSSRREVKKGLIQWYDLNWARKMETFKAKRIIFPYKAKASYFTIGENIWHSADVYSFIPKEGDYIDKIIEFLNSSLYDSLIKLYLKKLGDDLYDYYPNRLKEVPFPYDFIKSGGTLGDFISLIKSSGLELI